MKGKEDTFAVGNCVHSMSRCNGKGQIECMFQNYVGLIEPQSSKKAKVVKKKKEYPTK